MDQLETRLADAQWLGGQQPSADDRENFEAVAGTPPSVESHPHSFAWFALVSKFTPAVRATWAAAGGAAKGKAAPAKKEEVKKEEPKVEVKAEAKVEDDFDPFADELDEEEVAQMERMKAKAAAAGKDKKKEGLVAKSLIIWEVKPYEAETDLDLLAKEILAIKMDGLDWKTEYKKEPVAYGVFKIVIGAVVEDEKVSTDDVQEKIEAMEELVQSVDIVAFNKL